MVLGVLLLLPVVHAAEGLRLPAGEDPALWGPLLEGTGLELVSEDPDVDIQVGHRLWRVEVCDGDSNGREVMVPPPKTEETRQDVVYLALSLLVPVPALAWPDAHRLAPPPDIPAPAPVPAEPVALVAATPEPEPEPEPVPAPEVTRPRVEPVVEAIEPPAPPPDLEPDPAPVVVEETRRSSPWI